jgi:hypothetical protein
MPKIEKASALYEHTEELISALHLKDFAGKSEGNLTSAMTSSIMVKTVISELIATGKSIPDKSTTEETNPLLAPPEVLDWLEAMLEPAAKAARTQIRLAVMPLATAAKNFQDSYCAPSELLHKSKLDDGTAQAEFD